MRLQGRYRSIHDLPATIPVFPLTGVLLLPRSNLPLNIFEPRYLAMVDAAMAGRRMIGMIQPRHAGDTGPRPPLMQTGCAGRITGYSEADDGRYLITLTGICRFRIAGELAAATPFRQAEADYAPFSGDLSPASEEGMVARGRLAGALRSYLATRNLDVDWRAIERAPAEALVNAVAMLCPFAAADKQALLEAPDLAARSKLLLALLELDETGPAGGAAIN